MIAGGDLTSVHAQLYHLVGGVGRAIHFVQLSCQFAGFSSLECWVYFRYSVYSCGYTVCCVSFCKAIVGFVCWAAAPLSGSTRLLAPGEGVGYGRDQLSWANRYAASCVFCLLKRGTSLTTRGCVFMQSSRAGRELEVRQTNYALCINHVSLR